MGTSKTTTQEMPAFQQEFLEETVIPFAEDFLATEYQPYTGERVAGMTPLQQQAMAGYGGLDMGSPLYGQAAATYGELAGFRAPEATAAEVGDVGALATTDYGQYMSPYTEAVIESGLRDLGGAQDVSLMQQAARAQKAKAFGGSRHGIAEAETRKTYGQQAADLVARERARAFEQAQRAAQFDITGEQQRAIQDALFQQQASLADQEAAIRSAGVRAGAAAGLGQTAGQQMQTQLAGLGAQTAAGEAQRALQQAQLDVPYQDYLAAMQYPLTQFGVLTGAAGAIPSGYGTTVQRTGGLGPALGALGSLGMGLGGLGGASSGIFNPLFGGGYGLGLNYNLNAYP